jgi:hypothetical protein
MSRLARDLEDPADRVEAIHHFLHPRAVAGRAWVEPAPVVGDLELEEPRELWFYGACGPLAVGRGE